MIQKIANVLKALGEPTRLKIIKFLSIKELCICELEAILDMSQPRVSQHMRVLKQTGLVIERKAKQKSYFTLNTAVLNGPFIETFNAFMQLNPIDIPELTGETQRYAELDSNTEVQACKNACSVSDENKKIV